MKKVRIFSLLIRTALLCAVTLQFATPSFSLDEDKFITDYLWQKTISLSPPARPKVALVLGGGGARGMAHIGILKVLEEEKVPVDMIVGTSVGALIGALYSADVPLDRIERMGETIRWNDLTNVSDSTLVNLLISEHLLSTEKMEQYLGKNIGNKRFDELKIPFACVATDLVTGERVILKEGEVALAARASSTIPGMFDPVEYRHRYLVDGGLFDNIPTDVAELMGADIIIAVAISSDFSKNNLSNVFMILTQSIYIQGRQFDEERLKAADIVIRPGVGTVTAVDLGHSRECIDAGVIAAHKAVPRIKELLIEKVSDKNLFK
jgi:NTE family protein